MGLVLGIQLGVPCEVRLRPRLAKVDWVRPRPGRPGQEEPVHQLGRSRALVHLADLGHQNCPRKPSGKSENVSVNSVLLCPKFDSSKNDLKVWNVGDKFQDLRGGSVSIETS